MKNNKNLDTFQIYKCFEIGVPFRPFFEIMILMYHQYPIYKDEHFFYFYLCLLLLLYIDINSTEMVQKIAKLTISYFSSNFNALQKVHFNDSYTSQ
jgi:hypothetical protein